MYDHDRSNGSDCDYSEIEDDTNDALTSTQPPQYACECMYDDKGEKMPFCFDFDFSIVHDSFDKNQGNCRKEQLNEAQCWNNGQKGHNHEDVGHSQIDQNDKIGDQNDKIGDQNDKVGDRDMDDDDGDKDIVHAEYVTLQNEAKVRIFGSQAACEAHNNRTCGQGTRTYRSVVVVFWLKKHSISHFLAYDECSEVIFKAKKHVEADDRATAIQYLGGILSHKDRVELDTHDFGYMLDICAVIGPQAQHIACETVSWLKTAILNDYAENSTTGLAEVGMCVCVYIYIYTYLLTCIYISHV
jgi:hypothetical protein